MINSTSSFNNSNIFTRISKNKLLKPFSLRSHYFCHFHLPRGRKELLPRVPICFPPSFVHNDISTGFPLFSEFPSRSNHRFPLSLLVSVLHTPCILALFIPFCSVPRVLLSPFTHVPFTCRRVRFHPVLSLNNSLSLRRRSQFSAARNSTLFRTAKLILLLKFGRS